MGTLSIQEQVALAPFTTIGVGGSARFFTHVRSEQELEDAVAFQQRHRLPFAVLGGGSNLLVRDEGFPGLVVHLDLKGETQMSDDAGIARCNVPTGTPWDEFVLEACKRNLSGVECLAGIPGLTGGTPVQNVGAYGQEVAQTISCVRVYDLFSRSFLEFTAGDCCFSYRSSRFNTQQIARHVVTAVTFDLRRDERPSLTYADLRERFSDCSPTPLQVYYAVREIRREKGMLFSADDPDNRSAGSFFRNPIIPEQDLAKISSVDGGHAEVPHWPMPARSGTRFVKLAAAWLVQNAGFSKGFTDGRVGISSRHSLALINRGGASFADLARLRDRIRSEVSTKFHIQLEQEPVELGPKAPDSDLPHRF